MPPKRDEAEVLAEVAEKAFWGGRPEVQRWDVCAMAVARKVRELDAAKLAPEKKVTTQADLLDATYQLAIDPELADILRAIIARLP